MGTTQPLFDMSKAQPIQAAGGAPLFDMSKAQAISDTAQTGPNPTSVWDTLKREVHAGIHTVLDTPSAVYHAVTDEPTQEETEYYGKKEVSGPKRVGLVVGRLLGAGQADIALDFYTRYAKATPEERSNMNDAMLSVAPEAIGSAGGAVVASKLAQSAIEAAPGAVTKVGSQATAVAEKLRNVTPKQAAQGVGAATGAGLGHGTLSAPGAYYGAKSAGLAAESILGQERANAPIFARKPVYPGAPYPEAPVSAPEAALTPTQQATALGKVPIKTVRQSIALAPNATPQVQAQALGQLRTATSDIVDQVLPPTGETKGANLRTKSQVEFYLKKGDLDTAQQVLETAAPEWKGRYNPAASKIEFPKAGREIVEDQAILDALRADLESHGYAAHSTMVKEQIARQSVDTQKWMRVAEARGVPQGMEPARPYPHFDEPLTDVDLTKVLEESLKQTKERLGSKQYRMTEADARQKFVAQNKK